MALTRMVPVRDEVQLLCQSGRMGLKSLKCRWFLADLEHTHSARMTDRAKIVLCDQQHSCGRAKIDN
jgi:hypothetical protein